MRRLAGAVARALVARGLVDRDLLNRGRRRIGHRLGRVRSWFRPTDRPADRHVFLVYAPPYTHASSGVRALYRLCHHLNVAGYPTAMVAPRAARLPDWEIPFHQGPAGRSIVIYPEIVSGNPYGARRVVRWVLNAPGLLAGDTHYAEAEMVFVYDAQMLAAASAATWETVGANRVIWFGLIDPAHIHPDPAVPKTMDLSFTHKGRALAGRFPLPAGADTRRLEDLTPDMAALGDVLREAVICGAAVRVVGADGAWHDPETCDCAGNIVWQPGFRDTYAADFEDRTFVPGFIAELRTRWRIPEPRGRRKRRHAALPGPPPTG